MWAQKKMEPNPDIGSLATQLPTDSGSGGNSAGTPVLEPRKRAENALHVGGPAGWDPYEVWWTQVRAVQMARASKIHSSSPGGQHGGRASVRPARFGEAARNVMLTVAHMVGSLNVRGVLQSLGYRRQ
jgi:hypothetical protein